MKNSYEYLPEEEFEDIIEKTGKKYCISIKTSGTVRENSESLFKFIFQREAERFRVAFQKHSKQLSGLELYVDLCQNIKNSLEGLQKSYKLIDDTIWYRTLKNEWISFKFEFFSDLVGTKTIAGLDWKILDLMWCLHWEFYLDPKYGFKVVNLKEDKNNIQIQALVQKGKDSVDPEIENGIIEIDGKFIVQFKLFDWYYIIGVYKTEEKAKKSFNDFNDRREFFISILETSEI